MIYNGYSCIYFGVVVSNLFIFDEAEVQQAFAEYLRTKRKQAKLSRVALAERSTVPAPTIKKFETTGQISFRQLLLLWQSLDDLGRLLALTQEAENRSNQKQPQTIEEVLQDAL